MARKQTIPERTSGANNGESVAGYFRKIFKANPRLLKQRSNDELLRHWLDDHPGETEIPKHVKSSLSNIKSILRSKRRRKAAEVEPVSEVLVAAVETGPSELEQLEEMIDDCLSQAKQMDRDGLVEVIDHLRRARNAVVWKIGE